MDTRRLKKRFGYGLAFGFLVIIGVMIWGDWRALQSHMTAFQWELLPLIVVCALLGYGLRFLKWDLYVRTLRIPLSVRESLIVFLSGLAMAITPGKAGELLKSWFLKRLAGVDIARTAPVVMAERVTDLAAMLLLAAWGFSRFSEGKGLLIVVSLVLLAGIVLLQFRDVCYRLFARLRKRLKKKAHWMDRAERFYDSSFQLFIMPIFSLATVMSLVSWGLECFAFYLIFKGLGLQQTLLDAVFIFSFSSIAGAVSMLPGGLGVAETSMVGLLIGIGAEKGAATVATLFGRFSTLWFGVIVGVIVWFGWGNRLYQKGREERQWERTSSDPKGKS